MPDDRTTRAKRALELAEKATEGPMQVEIGYLTCCDGPERVVVSAPARDSADGLSGYCVASFGTDDAALCDAQLFAESRTLLPALARDVIELEAEAERLSRLRDDLFCRLQSAEQQAGFHASAERSLSAELLMLAEQIVRDISELERVNGGQRAAWSSLAVTKRWAESLIPQLRRGGIDSIIAAVEDRTAKVK